MSSRKKSWKKRMKDGKRVAKWGKRGGSGEK